MKISASGLCHRVIWCINIKCTGMLDASFFTLCDDTRIFVINVLPTKLHGIISQKNIVFLFAANVELWASQKLCSEASYCYRFM